MDVQVKRKRKKVRRESTIVNEIYDAVQRYIKFHGGDVVVIGGLEIQQWPLEPEAKFRVAIQCLGRKPEVRPLGEESE
jgi:hypothetical protein